MLEDAELKEKKKTEDEEEEDNIKEDKEAARLPNGPLAGGT